MEQRCSERAAFGEVVLVVEDEAAVRDIAVESLSELGCASRTSANAAAVIALLRGEGRIDIRSPISSCRAA